MDDEGDFTLFDHLAQKQAQQEIKACTEDDSICFKETNALLAEVLDKREEFSETDLYRYKNRGANVSPELLIIVSFMKGIALPLLETDELKSASLGKLGVCLYVGTQLFAFHDAQDGQVYLSQDQDRVLSVVAPAHRFAVMYSMLIATARTWEGHIGGEVNPGQSVEQWEQAWAGGEPKTGMDALVRFGFGGLTIVYNSERISQIQFDMDMRKAMGLTNDD